MDPSADMGRFKIKYTDPPLSFGEPSTEPAQAENDKPTAQEDDVAEKSPVAEGSSVIAEPSVTEDHPVTDKNTATDAVSPVLKSQDATVERHQIPTLEPAQVTAAEKDNSPSSQHHHAHHASKKGSSPENDPRAHEQGFIEMCAYYEQLIIEDQLKRNKNVLPKYSVLKNFRRGMARALFGPK